MPFKLVFVAASPDQYVLHGEKKLRGLDFLTTASGLLRRVVDDCVTQEHKTFADRSYYCCAIPNRVAIDSGKYENTDVYYVLVKDNYLKSFLFYSADFRCGRNGANYPFVYKDTVTITSHIDELALIQKWMDLGYPAAISIAGGTEDPDNPSTEDPGTTTLYDIPVVQDVSDVKNPTDGYTVFDIIEGANLDTNNQ